MRPRNITEKALPPGIPEKLLQKLKKTRDKAMVVLMWRGGLRSDEARCLKVGDLKELSGGQIRVRIARGKGGVARDVRIGAIYAKFITRQVRRRKSGWLLDTCHGHQAATSTFRRTLSRMKYIHPDINPHALRHCCARDLMKEGFEVRVIQKILGHKSLLTTQIYLDGLAIEQSAAEQMGARD